MSTRHADATTEPATAAEPADPDLVSEIRRFNRTVTQRLGVLDDHYLARDRSLGEARLLWEIGEAGCDVRELRRRLDLDSGYTSRLLRSLESAGLVAVDARPSDRRVRIARLTAAGRKERTLLNLRSDELATSFLDPLNASQRRRLVAAMGEVERLLTAGLVEVDSADPDEPEARSCLTHYFTELAERFEGGFDAQLSNSPDPREFRPPHGVILIARLRAEPVGCGALRLHRNQPAEIKRMWVCPATRGLGVGRRLLAALEERATTHGAEAVRLETNRTLVEAIAMYRSAGFTEIPAYNDEYYADHWFEKQLRPDQSASSVTNEAKASR